MVEEVVGVADDPLPGTVIVLPPTVIVGPPAWTIVVIYAVEMMVVGALLMTIVSPFPRILKIVVGSGK